MGRLLLSDEEMAALCDDVRLGLTPVGQSLIVFRKAAPVEPALFALLGPPRDVPTVRVLRSGPDGGICEADEWLTG
jgi:hypothetical protein